MLDFRKYLKVNKSLKGNSLYSLRFTNIKILIDNYILIFKSSYRFPNRSKSIIMGIISLESKVINNSKSASFNFNLWILKFKKVACLTIYRKKGRYSFKKKEAGITNRTLTKSKYLKIRSLSILKKSNILNLNKFIIKQKIWGEHWACWVNQSVYINGQCTTETKRFN